MTIETDIDQLIALIDAMLADVSGTNIVETTKVTDFMLDARLITASMKANLVEPVAV